ncbi:hypothetical protein LTR78_009988 [Recurvomyces mirabilis]|uniref:Uncharacterized protein n=1 Tax=Recurvomyces mirabilis TaxID=574656 RepID=A0AAE0TSV1_9PEZI|nr:hypothetical protein LTR78_009988 [Recurvomyces mirabilis]KAK5160329.1 hypothetical protein LTS14_001341 [Recurvomyces mirabilis]
MTSRPRRPSSTTSTTSNPHNVPPTTTTTTTDQEMASMYDYLAKIILLGPSASGKSCLLHRFLANEWRTLSSQTIGVEFASKIIKVGSATNSRRRKRVKLQLWDTAGTERFRSVSRSYYRGAAGAVLVYDLADTNSFAQLQTFLDDARALGSPRLTVVLVGNKADLTTEAGAEAGRAGLLDDVPAGGLASSARSSTLGTGLGSQRRATRTEEAEAGRAVPPRTAAAWAAQNRLPPPLEVSALSGTGVTDLFTQLASSILTKIELGEIDPDDALSGIQYGDADYLRFREDDDGGSSVKSGGGLTSDGYGSTRRRRKGRGGWGDVFNIAGRNGMGSGSRGGGGKCC